MEQAEGILKGGAETEDEAAQPKARGKSLLQCAKQHSPDDKAVLIYLTGDPPPAKTLGGKRQRRSKTGVFSDEEDSTPPLAEDKGSGSSSEGTPEYKWTCVDGCCSDQVGLTLSLIPRMKTTRAVVTPKVAATRLRAAPRYCSVSQVLVYYMWWWP